MTFSRIFLFFCLSFVLGIFLNSFFKISQQFLLSFLIISIFLISIFWSKTKVVVLGICIIFLVVGIFRHEIVDSKSNKSELTKLNKSNKIILIGTIIGEPISGEKTTRLIFRPTKINNSEIKSEGNVLITVFRYPEYKYGDELKIEGFLKTPIPFENFNYQEYLKKEGVFSVMDFPKTEKIRQDKGNKLLAVLFVFKNNFLTNTRKLIPLPQEGFLEALIFGNEENISQEWKEKLNLTGTRHIAAVSGMNITIIASLIFAFALKLGLWRNQAFYLSMVLLFFYVLMIGAPASGVRAGVMAGILLLAQYLGRMAQMTRAIVFALTVMLALNPLLLSLDVGFQLSFLAILGICYLQPILAKPLNKIPEYKFFPLKTTLLTSLSAQIFTFPILVYNFGQVSLISPISNLFIVPFLASITILIFIFGFLSLIFSPLALVFSWPTWLFLAYITKTIDIFSKISFASIVFNKIHLIWPVLFYLFLVVLIFKFRRKGIVGRDII